MGLDTVELVMAVESEFGLTIPDEVAPSLERLGDLQRFVIQVLEAQGKAVDPKDVWERLKAILRRDFAVRAQALVPEAHIALDLGLD